MFSNVLYLSINLLSINLKDTSILSSYSLSLSLVTCYFAILSTVERRKLAFDSNRELLLFSSLTAGSTNTCWLYEWVCSGHVSCYVSLESLHQLARNSHLLLFCFKGSKVIYSRYMLSFPSDELLELSMSILLKKYSSSYWELIWLTFLL
mgnify:CR=1 FL=1